MSIGLNTDSSAAKAIGIKATPDVVAEDLNMATRLFYNSYCARCIPMHEFTYEAEVALVAHLKFFLTNDQLPYMDTVPTTFCKTDEERVS